jgi:asparagine synthase (glutamine-hydrolysing)
MCGIAGGVGAFSPTKDQLAFQLRQLEHRGPDNKGSIFGSNYSLGMCRLSINEVSNGIQPVSDIENKVHLVFNGEIYNYKKIFDSLDHDFKKNYSRTEANVIIALYNKYNQNFVEYLDGMFAIALYDEKQKKLILARDRIGKKPLLYSKISTDTLIFASEAKALYKLLPNKTLNQRAISDVMTLGYVPGPNTAIEEIKNIPPGCIGIFQESKLEISKYWSLNFETNNEIKYKEAKDTTKKLITNAIEKRLISERPIGSYLSGGIDSTVVTSIMAQLSTNYVESFSIGFSNKNYDETQFSKLIAHEIGVSHNEKIIQSDPSLILEKLSFTLDLPFADSSIIPTYLLSEFASQKVVVVLGGDGGDEVFGGYERYRSAPILQKLSPILKYFSPLRSILLNSNLTNNRRLKRLIEEMTQSTSLADKYLSIMSLTKGSQISRIVNSDHLNYGDLEEFKENFCKIMAENDLSLMINSDFNYYLSGDLLVKADMASMAHGIELRSPLLDYKLIEWVNQLPSSYKIKGSKTKFILKDIASDLVPYHLVNRPKMGFAIPRAEWLRTGLKEITNDLLRDKTALNRGWFNNSEVLNCINLHNNGKDMDSVLWPMLMLELWARNWLD